MAVARPSTPAAGGVALALLAALSFGTIGLWGKLAPDAGLSTPTLLTWRFALGALALAALSAALERGRAPAPSARLRMLAFGALYAVATSCYFGGLARISAGTTALLLYLAPAFVVLYAALLGARPTRAHLGAVGLTLAGLAVVIGLPGAGDRDPVGLLLATLAGALYGVYLLGSEKLLGDLPPIATSAHVSAASAVGFAALGLVDGTLGVPATPAGWGLVAAMTVIPTLVALPALFAAIARIGAARASVIATLEPLFTVLLAALFLGEAAGAARLAGGGLILAGAVLAQKKE